MITGRRLLFGRREQGPLFLQTQLLPSPSVRRPPEFGLW